MSSEVARADWVNAGGARQLPRSLFRSHDNLNHALYSRQRYDAPKRDAENGDQWFELGLDNTVGAPARHHTSGPFSIAPLPHDAHQRLKPPACEFVIFDLARREASLEDDEKSKVLAVIAKYHFFLLNGQRETPERQSMLVDELKALRAPEIAAWYVPMEHPMIEQIKKVYATFEFPPGSMDRLISAWSDHVLVCRPPM